MKWKLIYKDGGESFYHDFTPIELFEFYLFGDRVAKIVSDTGEVYKPKSNHVAS